MKRQEQFAYIEEHLCHLCTYVKYCGCKNYTDINRIAEGFLNTLLNIVYKFGCEDMNQKKLNFPGVDLGNESTGIGIQVTSRCDSEKVLDTYKKIYNEYNAVNGKLVADMFCNQIVFFCISVEKRGKFGKKALKNISTVSHGRFKEADIITVQDLISDTEKLFDVDHDCFIKAYECISNNIDTLPSPITDKVVLEQLLHYFNRPAFTVDFKYECCLEDFENAITETISNINLGRVSAEIGKDTLSTEDLGSRQLKKRFAQIVDGLNLIRKMYCVMVDKEYTCKVDIGNERVIYTDCEVIFCRAMNDLRSVVLHELKIIADSEDVTFDVNPDYYKDSFFHSPIIKDCGNFMETLNSIFKIYADKKQYEKIVKKCATDCCAN